MLSSSIDGPIYSLKLDKLNDAQWTVDLNSAKYGPLKFATVTKAIIDTGTSFLSLAQSDFTQFENEILNIPQVGCSSLLGYCSANVACSEITPQMNEFKI